ncbi:uncharacterized protein LOC120129560 [Hibiscus syriacus]|uniref:uncharacterized protein LOC120129560 n=1 Tax=Hibiscus syriacus TaxID=106335 RepID=UPI00192483CF|nr:uncharacterized protein LOC120129560 [Hibiscus syriacus]
MEQETEIRGSRMCYPKDQNEAYFHCKILKLQQEGSTQHISLTEEVGINGQSPMQHPKKRIIDLREIRETRISTLTQTSDVLDDEILDIERSDEDSGLQWNITDSDYPFCSSRMQEVPQSTNRKSIKQRLGRSCRVNYLDHQHRKNRKQRLSPPYQAHRSRRSIKQRLGPPCQNHNPIGRHKTRKPMKENENKVHIPTAMPRIEKHKVRKHVKGNVSESHKGVHARDDVLHSTKRGRTEPPEDSDEFKQLVHGAYVKFIKALNENPAQRRKYTDKGETKNLKCCVCGSKSEDFVDNVSLVMHAFTSRRNRVEHLGLHKALCLLMGWGLDGCF